MSSTTRDIEQRSERKELPEGWRWIRLGEVCELNPRRPFIDRHDSELTSFIPMESVDAVLGVVSSIRERPYGEVKNGYTFFAEADVLFAKITPCMQNGKHAIAVGIIDGIGFGTTEFHVIRPSESIISEFIWFFVRQPIVLADAIKHFTGAIGQQRVPEGYLAELEIPLPPLSEQQRIAAILNDQMGAVEKARTAAQERLRAIKALPAAFLRQIFPDIDQPIPYGWRWVKLGELCDPTKGSSRIGPFGSSLRKDELSESGIPVIGIENILPNRFESIFRRYLSPVKYSQLVEYTVKPGDVLVTTMGTIGRCAVVPDSIETAIIDSHLFRFRLNLSEAVPAFICYTINGFEDLKRQLEKKSSGAIMAGLNTTILRDCLIPLPPLPDQQRIAVQLKAQMVAVEKARKAAEAELKAINALPAALLRRAFNGEL